MHKSIQLCGVIGHPVSHSLSPLLHNAAFEHFNLPFVYLTFDVLAQDLDAAIEGMRALSIRGFSVTTPHKVKVMEWLDEIDPMALKIGAVNTVVNDNGCLTGYNTDGDGALRALTEITPVQGKKIMLLGAGGAARAIGTALVAAGADLLIVNRTADKAVSLAANIGAQAIGVEQLSDYLPQAEIIYNATTVGMSPESQETPIPTTHLRPEMIVIDAIYHPLRTQLLEDAARAGCKTIAGSRMLLWQAVRQFQLFTNSERDPSQVMQDALITKLAETN